MEIEPFYKKGAKGGKIMGILHCTQIEHKYQPMWNLDAKKIFGYEALLRFTGDTPGMNDIERVFHEARMEGCLYELDTMSIESAIKHFPLGSLHEELLFINIYPSTLLDDRFHSFLIYIIKFYCVVPEKIVFELNETVEEEHIWVQPEFKHMLHNLKSYGFNIALDDIGKGAGTLQKIIDFAPDYIKLDRYFSEGLSTSKEKQEMISLFIQYAKQKMGLILEGIEKDVDLAHAKLMHVPVVQGYLLGRPQRLTGDTLFHVHEESLSYL
jgi:EAL domain-containing protein (putative c-di-GMP-specific phosphodiesterase class I)